MPLEVVELPITGKIIAVEVKKGDRVKQGDTICVVESMKMENPIPSPVTGIVKELPVQIGKFMNTGDKLAVIEY